MGQIMHASSQPVVQAGWQLHARMMDAGAPGDAALFGSIGLVRYLLSPDGVTQIAAWGSEHCPKAAVEAVCRRFEAAGFNDSFESLSGQPPGDDPSAATKSGSLHAVSRTG